VTRLQASRDVAARGLAPSEEALDTPLGPPGSLPVPGVCYSALRRLPRRDLHPLEPNDKTVALARSRRHDATCRSCTRARSRAASSRGRAGNCQWVRAAARSWPTFPVGADSPLLWHRYRAYCGGGLGCAIRSLFRRIGLRTASGRLPRLLISAPHLRSRPYSAGIAPVTMCRPSCRSWPTTWGTSRSSRLRTTCRSSSHSPPRPARDSLTPVAHHHAGHRRRRTMRTTVPNALARALRGFFADHLPRVRGSSPHTIFSYRDSLVLFLRFVADRRKRSVSQLDLQDLGPAEVLDFLQHLESARQNQVATRNVRLAAIHAFFRFCATEEPRTSSCVNACSPSRSSAAARVRSSALTTRRSRRCSPPWIGRRPTAVATMCCWPRCSTLAPACRNSSR
jgi:hypothetical protein